MVRVTSTEVAAAAGVSRATVSYVLNGRADKKISESTRQAVYDAVRELGYLPSAAARVLRSGRAEIVVALLPDWAIPGEFGRLLEIIGDSLDEHGLPFVLYHGSRWRGQLSSLLGYIPAACLVTFEPLEDADAAVIQATGTPEVRAWLLDVPQEGRTTLLNQRDVVQAQITHLLEAGCERLIFARSEDAEPDPFEKVRHASMVAICDDARIDRSPSIAAPGEVAGLLLELERAKSDGVKLGVCAFNDETAAAVLSAARLNGLWAPSDFGIVGVDNSAFGPFLDPPLTSIAFDMTLEAFEVTANVLRILNPDAPAAEAPDRSAITLVVRDSS